ncbi:hypothetical protein AAFC00_004001 [Neodothiora populina]|uniref:Nucleoside transporter family n=1 Tax=Neodothiora populina TaxID=2781224 RepID=A0ABR3PIA8_9PEZI
MYNIKKLWQREQPYEPVTGQSTDDEREDDDEIQPTTGFSWLEYLVFLTLGVAMLWAWNMLLAAGPYFQRRFSSSAWISHNFQAAELSVSSITNLGSMVILSKMQAKASYSRRIVVALIMNIIAFTLLALSTTVLSGIEADAYFVFIICIVFTTSLATAFCQNGVFAFVAGFGQERYTQGIMTGQAVAGVLPCIAQIVSVLSVRKGPPPAPHSDVDDAATDRPGPPPVPSKAAFAYFLTATAISVFTLVAFIYLLRRHQRSKAALSGLATSISSLVEHERKPVPFSVLFRKLRWLAGGVFITFAITMFFPVFTQMILSVRDPAVTSPILHPPSFIPLAFLFWNSGDLLGRLIPALPQLSLTSRPKLIFVLAISRVIFIPLYQLCNIRGHGAIVNSDVFYLVVVQLLFGMSNGYVGSICMMGASEWVDPEEREAAGGFMGMCLVAGLAAGSLASFFAAGA